MTNSLRSHKCWTLVIGLHFVLTNHLVIHQLFLLLQSYFYVSLMMNHGYHKET